MAGPINTTNEGIVFPASGDEQYYDDLQVFCDLLDARLRSFELKRSDTGVYQTPLENIEYESPYQHLGLGSTVYCQYKDISSPVTGAYTDFFGAAISGATVDLKIVQTELYYSDGTANYSLEALNDSDVTLEADIKIDGTYIKYIIGTGITALGGWIHYTK